MLRHVEHNLAVEGAERLDPAGLATLVIMEADGELTATQGKAVLAEMVATGGDPVAIAKEKGFEAMGADALTAAVDEVLASLQDLRRMRQSGGNWMRYFWGLDSTPEEAGADTSVKMGG